jgi:hypothetical protein
MIILLECSALLMLARWIDYDLPLFGIGAVSLLALSM